MLKTCVKKQGCYGSKDPETDHGNVIISEGLVLQDAKIWQWFLDKEGAIRYSVSLHTFQDMAREAGAVIKCKGISLVDTTIFEEYLDSFRIENN